MGGAMATAAVGEAQATGAVKGAACGKNYYYYYYYY